MTFTGYHDIRATMTTNFNLPFNSAYIMQHLPPDISLKKSPLPPPPNFLSQTLGMIINFEFYRTCHADFLVNPILNPDKKTYKSPKRGGGGRLHPNSRAGSQYILYLPVYVIFKSQMLENEKVSCNPPHV